MVASADLRRLKSLTGHMSRRLLALAIAAAAALILSSPPATPELRAESPGAGRITINVSGPATVAEGETATYTISLSPDGALPPPGANFAVNYRTRPGTAIQLNQQNRNSADYDWADGIVTFNTFNPGPIKVTVKTFDDNRVEEDETFRLIIEEGFFAMHGHDDSWRPRFGTSSVTTTISSDDVVSADISLSISPPAMAEGDGDKDFVVTATLNGDLAAGDDIPIAITLGGTATPGSDYKVKTALSSITIPANSNTGSGTLTLTPIDDTVVELDEMITVSGVASGLSVDPALITLRSQMTDVSAMSISGPSGEVPEGTNAVFTATLSNLVSSPITVEWRGQSPDCCDYAEPEDYGSGGVPGRYPRGSFVIPPNTLVYKFSIPVVDDNLAEPAERFAILIGEISGKGLTAGAITASAHTYDARGFATIPASDQITVNLSGPAAVDEDSGSAEYTVSLSGGVPIGDITVSYTTDGDTAEAGSDYTAKFGSLTFTPADHADQTITVPITDDSVEEQDETFEVRLRAVSGGGGQTPVLGTSSLTTTIRGTASEPAPAPEPDVKDVPEKVLEETLEIVSDKTTVQTPVETPAAASSRPGRPTGLSVAPPASSSGSSTVTFTLSWSAPTYGGAPSGYRVLRRAPATEPNFRVVGSVTGTSFADTTAKPRTKYVYRVTAVNALGQSAQSDAAEIFYRPVGPGRVSGLSASANASGASVSLSWSAPSSGSAPTGYQILRRAVATESSLVVLASVSGGTNTSFVDSTATPGVKYVYRVKARNSVGLGQESLPTYAMVKKK